MISYPGVGKVEVGGSSTYRHQTRRYLPMSIPSFKKLTFFIIILNIMSVTTTIQAPAAISLRLTGQDTSLAQPRESEVTSSSWPQEYHRTPSYRPINRDLIGPERPGGSNGPERVFITLMFTGVATNAVSGPF